MNTATLDKSRVFNPLTMDQLKESVPSAFTEHKSPITSSKYTYASTAQMLEDITKFGWLPHRAEQRRVKNPKLAGYQLHKIILRNPDLYIPGEGENQVEAFPEITLINSHDGLSALTFSSSLYRVACKNGLIIQSNNYGNIRLIHKGFSFEHLRDTVEKISETIPHLVSHVGEMQRRIMTPEEMKDFIDKALKVREKYSQGTPFSADFDEMNKALRPEDEGDNLWLLYNRTQEKILAGGFKNTANERQAKRIQFLDKVLWINKDLFALTQQYLPAQN